MCEFSCGLPLFWFFGLGAIRALGEGASRVHGSDVEALRAGVGGFGDGVSQDGEGGPHF